MHALRWIAQNFGSEKALKINHLHDHDKTVTGLVPRQALFGALVEFSTRANPRFAHG